MAPPRRAGTLALVLGDQLNRASLVLAGLDRTQDTVLMVEVPEEAREVRNVAEVTIDGRDKTFSDTESLAPRGYTREIEFEGIIDTLDPLTITDDEGNTFTVIVDDETEVDGDLVAGTEVEVEGVLRPDGNVLAFQIEIEDA